MYLTIWVICINEPAWREFFLIKIVQLCMIYSDHEELQINKIKVLKILLSYVWMLEGRNFRHIHCIMEVFIIPLKTLKRAEWYST
jgi:hypothetical protein